MDKIITVIPWSGSKYRAGNETAMLLLIDAYCTIRRSMEAAGHGPYRAMLEKECQRFYGALNLA